MTLDSTDFREGWVDVLLQVITDSSEADEGFSLLIFSMQVCRLSTLFSDVDIVGTVDTRGCLGISPSVLVGQDSVVTVELEAVVVTDIVVVTLVSAVVAMETLASEPPFS